MAGPATPVSAPAPAPAPAPVQAAAQATAATSEPQRAHERSLRDFPRRSRAEKILLDCCRRGARAVIGDGTRPEKATRDNKVRAGFVRFLVLGGDGEAPVHEHGVELEGAWLTETLDLRSAKVERPLVLLRCVVGRVDLRHSQLKLMSLEGSRLTWLGGDGLHCEGSVSLSNGFRVDDKVLLHDAEVGGAFDCSGGIFKNAGDCALSFDSAAISGSVFLSNGFHATGEVRLIGAKIGSAFVCSGRFENPGNDALTFDRAVITGSVFLHDGFHATGEVRLPGADIGGSLVCNQGRFENVGKDALTFDGATVAQFVFMNAGFHATGQVRSVGAVIRGNFECGGRFENESGRALVCARMTISGDMFLKEGFQATGTVFLDGAVIGGSLYCSGASFSSTQGDALDCEGATIGGTFAFEEVSQVNGPVRLSSLRAGALRDDVASWKGAAGRLRLDGFTYGRLSGDAATDAATRIDWLNCQLPTHLGTQFRPQPWEQLIAVLRAMGHPNEARRVAVAKQRRLRSSGRLARGTRALHWLYGFLVGYGYQPVRLLSAIPAVWLLCGFAYSMAAAPSSMGEGARLLAPAGGAPEAACLADPPRASNPPCPDAPPDYATFAPFIYSADVLLPVADLGYQDQWRPVVRDHAGNLLPWGVALRYLYWFEILFGWLAGGLLVSVVTGLIKKD